MAAERFDFLEFNNFTGRGMEREPTQSQNGDYVKFTDYETLRTQLAEANGRLADWDRLHNAILGHDLPLELKALVPSLWPFDGGQDPAMVALMVHGILEQLATLKAERDLFEANDRRYRWLRDSKTTFGISAQYDDSGKQIFYLRLPGYGADVADVDAAIDAAIGAGIVAASETGE